MKSSYLFVSFLASLVNANPIDLMSNQYGPGQSDVESTISSPPSRAPDPPLAPIPLQPSVDGVLTDGSVINYNPSNGGHSCWTPPASRPPPSSKIKPGTCSVCMVQHNGTDGSADYQLWARDNDNNAMGNMGPTTVWPIDDQSSDPAKNNIAASMPMGGSPLLLRAALSSAPPLVQVTLVWATPPRDPTDPEIWSDKATPNALFDPAAKGDRCTDAGNAVNGQVRYAVCSFDC